MYNLEVLTGFLLVVELTAVLVIILFLLALNFEGRRSSHPTPMVWGYSILFVSYAFFCHVFTRPQPFKFLNALGH